MNGTASANVPGRRRVHAVPKTIIFEVEVERDGESAIVEMTGFMRERCPVWVDIEVSAARDEYLAAAYVDTEVTDPESGETATASAYRYSREAEARYRRDVLLAAVKGLEEQQADVLLQSGEAMDMLADLGWFTRPTLISEDAPADPEGAGGEIATAQTGADSSPARRSRTRASTS